MSHPKLPNVLPLGKVFIGPEFPECINSGAAPVILKSKKLASAAKYGLTDKRYIVGPQGVVQEFMQEMHDFARLKNTWDSPIYGKHRKAYLFKNAAAAKRKFLALCEEMEALRREEREKRAALVEKAKSGHPDDLMNLAFHDMDNR